MNQMPGFSPIFYVIFSQVRTDDMTADSDSELGSRTPRLMGVACNILEFWRDTGKSCLEDSTEGPE